jgi:hypothetical protein
LPPPNLIQFPNPSLRFQTQVIAIRSVLFFSFSSHARTWCFLDHSEFSSGMSVYVTPFRRTCIVPSLSGLRSGTPQKQRDNMKIQRWCCCYTCLSRSSKLIGGLLIAKSRRTETVRTAVLVRRRHGNTATPRASVAKACPASCLPTARRCFGRECGEY